MRMKIWWCWVALFLFAMSGFLASCGTPDTKPPDKQPPKSTVEDHKVKVPTAPAKGEGMQFVQPEAVIKAGSEKMLCWIPNWIPDKDYYVTKFVGHQSKMGHHVVALSSSVPRKAGESFDCTDLEQMTTVDPLILPDSQDRVLLPEGHAVLMPKGSRIVIQSHYVNTSDKDIKIADVAQFYFHTKKEPPKVASYLIINHGGIKLAPGKGEAKVTCPIKKEMDLLLVLGHMHEYGTSIKITHERGGESKPLYSIDKWRVDYRDDPPITFYYKEQAKTFKLMPGDKLHLKCHFDNTTKGNILFPAEMCVMVGYYTAKTSSGIIKCNVE